MASNREILNANLEAILTPIIDVPQHLQANQYMLDYVDQAIADIVITGGTGGGVTLDTPQTITGKKILAPTISATANNQELIGMELNPTFNAGSYSGTSNVFMKWNLGQFSLGVGGNPRVNSTDSSVLILEGALATNIGKNTNLGNADSWVNIFSKGNTKAIASFYNSAGTKVMLLNESGNLLINTTTDTGDKLRVNGTINTNRIKFGTYGSLINEESIRMYIQARNDTFDILNSSGTTYVASLSRVNNSHKFYGPTANNRFVEIKGDSNSIYGHNGYGFIELYHPSNGNVTIANTSTTDIYGNIRFLTQNTERARFSTGGNLLIGTTTDAGQKLQVSGNISLVGAGGGYVYGDSTNPFLRLSNGAGSQFGYAGSYLSIGGAGFLFIGKVGATTTTNIQYRTANGMRISDGAATDPGSDGLQAMLALTSTNKGFLPPRLTTSQRDAIVTPPAGLMLYNSTSNQYNFYNGTAWTEFSVSGGTGGGAPSSESLTISSNANHSIASGVGNVTVIHDGLTADKTQTLPDPTTNTGRVLTIVHSGEGIYDVVLSHTVKRSSTVTTDRVTQGSTLKIMSDGANYWQVN